MNTTTRISQFMALTDAQNELVRATEKFPPFNSAHEGFAVLEEEVLELRNEVFWGKDPEAMRQEAVQVAAMALRFLTDVCVK